MEEKEAYLREQYANYKKGLDEALAAGLWNEIWYKYLHEQYINTLRSVTDTLGIDINKIINFKEN